jgi:predicted transposase YbfD/YdcC
MAKKRGSEAVNCKNILSIIMVIARKAFTSGIDDKESSDRKLTHNKAELIENEFRKHFGIENKVHWVLEVIFNEDYSRKRYGNAAKNFTNINRIALNILLSNDRKICLK